LGVLNLKLSQMNNLKFIILNILGICLLAFNSCSKNESPYFDYKNVVQTFNGTAIEYLESQPSGTFDSLLLVINRFPHLKDTLQNQGVTLFAPVNESFASAVKYLNIQRNFEGKNDLNLSTVNQDSLEILISKYIIRGNKTTDDYINERDGITVYSVLFNYPMHIKYVRQSSSGFMSGGASVLNFSNPFGSTFTQDWIITSTQSVNIQTNNATINVLTSIHTFGFDEFTELLNNEL
jgi:hypothetical protein